MKDNPAAEARDRFNSDLSRQFRSSTLENHHGESENTNIFCFDLPKASRWPKHHRRDFFSRRMSKYEIGLRPWGIGTKKELTDMSLIITSTYTLPLILIWFVLLVGGHVLTPGLRRIDRLRPADPEIEGFCALMMLTHARRAARTDQNGVTVPLARQDRRLWDRQAITEGVAIIERALSRRQPGPYQIKAAIAACHCEGQTSDWPQIVALYTTLFNFEPTAIVRLNRAVAIAEAGALDAGMDELSLLADELAHYQPFHAAKAELLARQGRKPEAKAAYAKAIGLAQSRADAGFLAQQRDALDA